MIVYSSRPGLYLDQNNTLIMQSQELTPKQQSVELLKQAQSVLIVTGRQPSADQLMGVYALQTILSKVGKKSFAVVSDSFPAAASLIDTSKISRSLDGVRDFIVSLDLSHVEVEKLKYDVVDGRLDITITPHAGNFTAEDARFDHGSYQFDLVIVLGVHAIVKIDSLLEQNPTLFDGLHLVNLDYHRVNDNYGSVNYIDASATSVCEMLIGVLESVGQGMIDADIATALLTGIMSATNRFTTANTTAKALTMSAQLMSAGARQQSIVKTLYASRTDRPAPKPAETKKVADTLPANTIRELQAAAEQLAQPAPVMMQGEPVELVHPTQADIAVEPASQSVTLAPLPPQAPLQ